MKINVYLGIILFCAIVALSILENLPAFIDPASLIIVTGGALSFGISSTGSFFSNARLEAASEGAVISGWLGLLAGIAIIASNIDDIRVLGPSMAVAILTVLYGYFAKAILSMILLSRNDG